MAIERHYYNPQINFVVVHAPVVLRPITGRRRVVLPRKRATLDDRRPRGCPHRLALLHDFVRLAVARAHRATDKVDDIQTDDDPNHQCQDAFPVRTQQTQHR